MMRNEYLLSVEVCQMALLSNLRCFLVNHSEMPTKLGEVTPVIGDLGKYATYRSY